MTHIPPSTVIEGLALSAVAAYQLAVDLIDQTSWDRMTGEHGAVFLLAIGVVVLWNSGRVSRKDEDARRAKEEESRERRHNESIASGAKNADELKALTVENIKSNIMVAQAIANMDRGVRDLSLEVRESCTDTKTLIHIIKKSPCLAHPNEPR
jgi:hypothetical protein